MGQTKFVLRKALSRGIVPIVVFNKVDREQARIGEVENEVFDLFVSLGASDRQLEFPMMYASGRDGWVSENPELPATPSMLPLLDLIVEHCPPPTVMESTEFAMSVTITDHDRYLGRMLIGKVESGVASPGQAVHTMDREGNIVDSGRISKLLKKRGIQNHEIRQGVAGDIVCLTGLGNSVVSNTVASPTVTSPLAVPAIDPPTVQMTFAVNDSPLSGKHGTKLTSQQISDRLYQEAEHNVSVNINQTDSSEALQVQGRGELQLGILIENMRREGFEISVSPPEVVFKQIDGVRCEPIEDVTIEVDDEYCGIVIEKLTLRKGELKNMKPSADGKTWLEFSVPSRGLIGYRAEFVTDTHGSGILNRSFQEYAPYRGKLDKVKKGALISMENGVTTAYALAALEDRGFLFVSPGAYVYKGMVIGEHNRETDLEVNPIREKRLTNFRTKSHEENIRLRPPRVFFIEEALAYVRPDEVVEITPKIVNIRKKILESSLRRRKG
eukprot:NODE_366_length_1586_cov_90.897875_g334_i0.p1 GENE.NODE_366_length_1586_cov_90.897875_g334_i0~~NODE_366_length_1586_cov_90.897875_g334_i0.p1  ORF type:complete len:498 (+),score=79.35 NODE_366_length_1586_cov_90.897875_g334_i0:60-1553(+)